MGTAMSERTVVMDEAAVEEIQKLKNGFVRQVLAKLTEMLATKQADATGRLLVTIEDVRQAMRELAVDPKALADIDSPGTPTAAAKSG